MFGNLGTIWAEIGLDTKKLDMGVAKASASLKGLSASQASIGKAMAGAAAGIGLVAGAVTVASIKMAADFDSSMRKVWSLTTESEAVFKSWKKEVLDLSSNLPQSADEMAQAFYWVKSNMPDASDADQLKTLEIAAKGAVGGVAELSDTVQALTQAQNAYKEMDPERYMSIMLKTVERGSITLQDFVNNQGKYVSSAALANISIEETSAAMATLTRNAIPADTAAMAINQTIMSFLKPTTEATDAANKYGIELSLAALRSKGLGAAMMEIAEKIPDDELTSLFPNIRALKAVFPLAGIAAADFAKDIGLMGGELDNLDRMYEKNLGTKEKWAIAIGKLKNRMIEFGEKILPTVEKAMEALGRIFDGKNETFNRFADIVKTVGGILWDLRGAIVAVGAAFLGWKIIGIITGVKTALTGLGAMAATEAAAVGTAFATGPAAVTAAAAGQSWGAAFLATAIKTISKGFASGTGFVIPLQVDVGETTGTWLPNMKDPNAYVGPTIQKAIDKIKSTISGAAPDVAKAMGDVLDKAVAKIKEAPVEERTGALMTNILDGIAESEPELADAVAQMMSIVKSQIKGEPVKLETDLTDLEKAKKQSKYGWPSKGDMPVITVGVDEGGLNAAKRRSREGWGPVEMAPEVDMSQVDAAKTRARQGWYTPVITPQVDMSQVTAAKTAARQGWVTDNLVVPISFSVNPVFDHPYDAGVYISGQLGKGMDANKPTATLNLAGLTEAQKRALNATNVLTATFGAFGNAMDALPFAEVELGIWAVTEGNWDAVGIWRQVRGELDLATATLKRYQDQLEESEKRVDSLSRREQKLNDSIAARQQRMNELTGMRLKGETAADDKTFAFQQKINKLELARLKAIDAGKYNEAARLAIEKKRLEKQLEIHELETSTTYDPQRREIEKVTDASRKQEMTLKDIIAEIKKTQRALEVETKQRDRISAVIKKERDAQWRLKIEIDNTSKVVDDLRSKVDVMADHFVTRLHEIKAAAEEAAAAVGGIAGGGVDVAGGSRILAPVGASGGGSSSSSVSSTTTNIFNIDHLHTQATNGESLMRDLRNYSLRRQVS